VDPCATGTEDVVRLVRLLGQKVCGAEFGVGDVVAEQAIQLLFPTLRLSRLEVKQEVDCLLNVGLQAVRAGLARDDE